MCLLSADAALRADRRDDGDLVLDRVEDNNRRRTDEDRVGEAERPPEPTQVPVYALQLAGIIGAAGLAGWAIRRLLRRRS